MQETVWQQEGRINNWILGVRGLRKQNEGGKKESFYNTTALITSQLFHPVRVAKRGRGILSWGRL